MTTFDKEELMAYPRTTTPANPVRVVGRLGLPSLVFLIFLALKLAGIGVAATWSWWLVTLPLWGSFALWAAFMVVAGVCGIIVLLIKESR